MAYLPVGLNLADRTVVIIGGGVVAGQKVKTLLMYGAQIKLYALAVSDSIKLLPVDWKEGVAYTSELLIGADVVYGATDDRALNAIIGRDGRAKGAVVNVVDDPANCDFTSPALHKEGDVSIAVTSNAKNVYTSIGMRNYIRDLLEKFPPPPFLSKEDARKKWLEENQ